MSATTEEPVLVLDGADAAVPAEGPGPAPEPVVVPARRTPLSARRCIAWVAVTVAAVCVVLYAVSPIFAQRSQHRAFGSFDRALTSASLETKTLYGYTPSTTPPSLGSSVAILGIGRLDSNEVVTEGVQPADTEKGPGHVPGTAGLGQPGNSVVVGRAHMFGGPFAHLSSLRPGDDIVVSTTEGQTLYVVRQERTVRLSTSTPAASVGFGSGGGGLVAPTTIGPTISVDQLFAASTDNRLTLLSSASVVPWGTRRATVVVATMKTLPFPSTPQQARNADEVGVTPGGPAVAPVVLALLVFAAAAVGAVTAYRRCPRRSAYLLSTAPLVLATVLLATAVADLLPAWS